MQRILITGASGFVGRNLYNELKQRECNVVGTYCTKFIDEMIKCDTTEFKEIRKLVEGADQVYMLATKTYGAGVMTTNPEGLVRENIIMNANTLQACYEAKVKKVLYLSSSTVYQEAFHPLEESELDLNKEPFPLYQGVGWVKRYTEKLCEFYNTLGMNIVVVRPTNIYGLYDKYEEGKSHFIPAIIKRVLEGQNPLIVWGRGKSIKDVVYVDDFVRDIMIVMKYHKTVEPLNLCSGELYTIKTICRTIINEANKIGTPMIFDETKPDSIPYRAISRNKFDSLYGKNTYTNLNKGIKNVVEWMKGELNERRNSLINN